MDRRHHATRAPSGEFDRGQGEREKASEALDRGPLLGSEVGRRTGREDQQLAFFIMQFECVAGEVFDPVTG